MDLDSAHKQELGQYPAILLDDLTLGSNRTARVEFTCILKYGRPQSWARASPLSPLPSHK